MCRRLALCQVIVCGLAGFQARSVYPGRVFAGGGLPDGVPGLSAALGGLSSVAADPAGNVYMASSGIAAVFRLDTSGILTRVAGTGIEGFSGDGGPAIDAEVSLSDTIAVALDGA